MRRAGSWAGQRAGLLTVAGPGALRRAARHRHHLSFDPLSGRRSRLRSFRCVTGNEASLQCHCKKYSPAGISCRVTRRAAPPAAASMSKDQKHSEDFLPARPLRWPRRRRWRAWPAGRHGRLIPRSAGRHVRVVERRLQAEGRLHGRVLLPLLHPRCGDAHQRQGSLQGSRIWRSTFATSRRAPRWW